MNRIRIVPHHPEGIEDTGSFEVRYPDDRESKYFYWDDNVGRRLQPDAMTSKDARAKAQAWAREKQEELDNVNTTRQHHEN